MHQLVTVCYSFGCEKRKIQVVVFCIGYTVAVESLQYMTYTVSGGSLNPTHSLAQISDTIIVVFWPSHFPTTISARVLCSVH